MKGYKFIGLANNPRAKMSHKYRALLKQRERIEAARRTAAAAKYPTAKEIGAKCKTCRFLLHRTEHSKTVFCCQLDTAIVSNSDGRAIVPNFPTGGKCQLHEPLTATRGGAK